MRKYLQKGLRILNKLLYFTSSETLKQTKTMENLTKEHQAEVAVKMVILDAIQKGHTNKDELIAYMASATFKKAVNGYMSMFN